MRVGVSGAGTAGSAISIFLKRMGHEVTIFEKVPTPQPVGSGLGLQPIGLVVLRRLGLLETIMKHGAKLTRLSGKTSEGKSVLDLQYSDYHPRLHGLGVHRGVLFGSLFEQVCAEDCNVVTGVDVNNTRITQQGTQVLVDSDGRDLGEFDLVVACDGRASSLRNNSGIPHTTRAYPYGCIFAAIKDEDNQFDHVLEQVYEGTRTFLGFLPIGKHLHDENGSNYVCMFWSLKTQDYPSLLEQGFSSWVEKAIRMRPDCEPLLRRLSSFDETQLAVYNDVTMPKFYKDNVVFLGDCAHAMSPQLGQGANLALVDAWKLSLAINSVVGAGDSESGRRPPSAKVAEALQMYNQERRWRLWFYQANSRMLTPVFQSDSRAIGYARDLVFGHLCAFPPTRWLMASTLVGAKAPTNITGTIPEIEYMGYLPEYDLEEEVS